MRSSHHRPRDRALRLANSFIVVGALAVCAWLALSLYQAATVESARERIFGDDALTPREAGDLETRLDRASSLNPDETIGILRAGLALRRGRDRQARATLLAVVRREPENLEAWSAIAIGFADTDPSLADRARAAIRRLSPLARE